MIYSRIISIALTALALTLAISDGQTTPFDPYAQVLVPDEPASIPAEANKIYTTTINLVPRTSTTTFNQQTFIGQAGGFYSSASYDGITLQGFVIVNNVRNTVLEGGIVQVIYDVQYNFQTLNTSVGGNDTIINGSIGNFLSVEIGLNQQPLLFSLYQVQENPAAFVFTGSSMCSLATCVGSFVTCIESEVSVTCVSECKTGYCYNDGICSQADVNSSPSCNCKVLPDLWYLGERCQTTFPLWLVIFLAVIGFLILLVVLLIICFCVIKKRNKKKKELARNEEFKKVFANKAFVNDEPKTFIKPKPRSDIGLQPDHAMSMATDDSFDTVTVSDVGALPNHGEYDRRTNATSRTNSTNHSRPRHYHHYDRHRDHDRRSNASSRTNNTHHSHHDHGRHRRYDDHHSHRDHRRHDDHHSHRDHRRHGDHRSHRDHRRHRSKSSERHRNNRPPSSSSSSESDVKNLSFYEVDVSHLGSSDNQSQQTTEATPSTTETSPVRSLPPRRIESRPGWIPSLGPMMYQLPRSDDNLSRENETTLPGYETIDFSRTPNRDTDL